MSVISKAGLLFRKVFNNRVNYLARMSSRFSYEDAVRKLNSLQSNKATLEKVRKEIQMGLKCNNITMMENYLSRVGVSLSELDTLSVIHVAGTKGKGSTSAMCESILRHHGYNTGFYSSPHLVTVCERIRLGGQVISKEKFARYFHEVYDLLDSTKEHEDDMPKYFAFLTVLAYKIFLRENVDVAIVEVGIGGVVDYTNVLRKVPVVGITSLGLDHTSILGNTIDKIAEAKAGIMKPDCIAYTVKQPPEAMKVLKKVAKDVKCSLEVVPDYEDYTFPEEINSKRKFDYSNRSKSRDENNCLLRADVDAYYVNASLAIQLSNAWMRIAGQKNSDKARVNGFGTILKDSKQHEAVLNDVPIIKGLPSQTLLGLKYCKWPGRYQRLCADYAEFYIDGAHTRESMDICAEWFRNKTDASVVDKVLIFSATGCRDVEMLLTPLKDVPFTKVYFVIPTAYKEVNQKNDNYSIMEQEELLAKCHTNADIWKNLCSNIPSAVHVEECVSAALKDIEQSNRYPDVLICGSLHLVGAALSILDPSLRGD